MNLPQTLSHLVPTLLALIASHPDVVAAIGAYVVLGFLNGVLHVKVDGGKVTVAIARVVDLVSMTARKDAHGTFKLPGVASVALRAVADAIDPPDGPAAGGGASSSPYRTPSVPPASDVPVAKRGASPFGVLAMAVLLLTASAPSCTPSPRPDGGVYQPSATLSALDTTASLLGILAPALKPLVLAQIPATDVEGRRAADVSITAFQGAASAWLAGRRTWEARGVAGYCDAYAATGAVTSALADVVRTLGRVGVGMNVELTALVDAAGLLADRIAYCDPVFDAAVPDDADVDAQARLRATSVAASLRGVIAHEIDAARDRGRPLSPLPNITH